MVGPDRHQARDYTSSFQCGGPGQGPVLLALRRPRQLLEHARGRRQGGQGPSSATTRLLEARGRSERVRPCRSACPIRLAGITRWSSKEVFLPQHNARFRRPRTGAPPSSPSPARSTTSCATERTVSNTTRCATSAWHFRSPPAATAAITSRPGSASTNTPTAVFHAAMSGAISIDSQTREAA